MSNSGTLFIISTPIGNLGDITLRAIEKLKEVDYVVTEDTRETGKLLKLLELPKKSLISYRDQIHERVFDRILSMLKSGQNLALVSDRGTPLISDPGYKLVHDLIQENIEITSIPGVTALIPALTNSGLPTDKFLFLGFLPRSTGKKQKLLQKITQFSDLGISFIIYESPYRIIKTLQTILETLGDIDISISSEITKLNEKTIRGPVNRLIPELTSLKIKGEWVIVGHFKKQKKSERTKLLSMQKQAKK